jgi:hypothetical protein
MLIAPCGPKTILQKQHLEKFHQKGQEQQQVIKQQK